MVRQAWTLVTLAAACTLTLAACSKQADGNPNASGSPGTGNGVAVVQPAAPDSPPGGSSATVGSGPGAAVPGTTGDASASSGTGLRQPGVGLNGGLSSGNVMGASPSGQAASAPMASPAGDGSPNLTPGSSVGMRH